jgi:hypothetical protein
MKRFTVVWWKQAHDELAELWLASADKPAISVAADAIDQELRQRAGLWVERSAEEPYFINVAMLRAYFRISEMDRLVEVVKVVRAEVPPV